MNQEIRTSGEFDLKLETCLVDHTKYYNTEYPQWNLRAYACLLVHESVHA